MKGAKLMEIVLLSLAVIAIIVMFIYLHIVIPYKEGYKGFKGIKEYYEKQTDKQQKQIQNLNDEYNKMKQEFIEYFNKSCDITNEVQDIDLEALWEQATCDKKIYKQLEKAHLAVEEVKRQYNNAVKVREEYNSFVNELFSEDVFPERVLNDLINIKKKFDKYYKYNENPYISIMWAGRTFVDELQRKQEWYEAMKQRGVDVEPLSIVEEFCLIHIKPQVEEMEKKLEDATKEAKEEAMLSAIEELKGQNMYLQQLLNNRK